MSTNNKFGSAAAAAAEATAQFLGASSVKSPDLHDVAIDPTGRIDVLAARALKLAVTKVQDPVLAVLYGQFQPVIDHQLHVHLGRIKAKAALEKLGLVTATTTKRTKARVKRVRVKSSGVKPRTKRGAK